MDKSMSTGRIFPDKEYPWNTDFYGPLTIPFKDLEITVNNETLKKYGSTILNYENLDNVKIEEDNLIINNEVSFKISKLGKVAGCYVTEGTIKRVSKIRLLRDSVVIHSGDLDTLKRHSDDAKEVSEGNECGISIKDFNDIQVNDVIESYEIESTPRKLEEK